MKSTERMTEKQDERGCEPDMSSCWMDVQGSSK